MHVYAMATCTHWTAGAALGSDQHAVVPVTASGRSPWATPMLRPPITSFDERSPEGKQSSEQRVLVCTELLHCTPSATLMRGTGRRDQTAWHMHCKGWPATGCNSGSCACNGVHYKLHGHSRMHCCLVPGSHHALDALFPLAHACCSILYSMALFSRCSLALSVFCAEANLKIWLILSGLGCTGGVPHSAPETSFNGWACQGTAMPHVGLTMQLAQGCTPDMSMLPPNPTANVPGGH